MLPGHSLLKSFMNLWVQTGSGMRARRRARSHVVPFIPMMIAATRAQGRSNDFDTHARERPVR
eukprot:9496956-Pyramimonas_sp.AAC.1